MKLNIAVCVVLAFCGIQSTVGYTVHDFEKVQISLKAYIEQVFVLVENATYQNKHLAETEVKSLKQEGIQKVKNLLKNALADINYMAELAKEHGVPNNKVSTCYVIAAEVLKRVDLNKHDEFEKIESAAQDLINGYVEKLKEVDEAKKLLLQKVDAGIKSCAPDQNLEFCEEQMQNSMAGFRKYHGESLQLQEEIKNSLEIPVKTVKFLNANTVESAKKEIDNAEQVHEKCLKIN